METMKINQKLLSIELKISAEALKAPTILNLVHFETYAVAWVDPREKARTRNMEGPNPKWDYIQPLRGHEDDVVNVEIYAVGKMFIKDRLIGAAQFLVSDIAKSSSCFSFTVHRRDSSKTTSHGVLNVEVKKSVIKVPNTQKVDSGAITWIVKRVRPYSSLPLHSIK